jgi:parvulin-like peptidyl-prolyl isomerase
VKITNITIFILIATIVFSCSSDSKPVAKYKYGVITQGEINKRAHGAKLIPQLKQKIIESLAVEGIAHNDALAAGYDKNETYLLRLERETWPVLKKIVIDKNMSALNLSLEYVKCRHIAFNSGIDPNSKKAALSKALKVIELLKKGAKFDSLIKSYSSDPQHAVAMSTVYVVKGGGNPDFENAALSLPTGTYTTDPVVLSNGTAVVIISDEKGSLTLDNLEKKVSTPNERNRLSEILKNKAYSRILAEVEKNNNAAFKIKVLPVSNTAVLFSVSGKDYILKDLKRRCDVFSGIIREPLENKIFLFNFAKEWYFSELYKAEAAKKGYLNDKKLISEIKSTADFILANDYIRYVCEKEIMITEKDMLDEYYKHKNNYMKMPETKLKKAIQLSYLEAKVFVRKKLIQARVNIKIEEWKKNALAESQLVFID